MLALMGANLAQADSNELLNQFIGQWRLGRKTKCAL